jgi:hypothetical protein
MGVEVIFHSLQRRLARGFELRAASAGQIFDVWRLVYKSTKTLDNKGVHQHVL